MISVVMSAYNAAAFLRPAVESILNQTYVDFEFIIVDDGSTDETISIARNYAQLDKRIRLIQVKHAGISGARNAGAEASKYPWIAAMDADDIALPHRLSRQMAAAAADPDVVAWGSDVCHLTPRGRIISINRNGAKTREEFDMLRRKGDICSLIHPTALLKKDVFYKAGMYNPSFQQGEDADLFDRMATFGPLLTISEPLLLCRMHSGSLSMTSFFKQRQISAFVIKRHEKRLAGLPPYDFDTYMADLGRRSYIARMIDYLSVASVFYYRSAGVCYADSKLFKAAVFLGLCAVLRPSHTSSRLWQQRLSPAARRVLKTVTTSGGITASLPVTPPDNAARR